MVKVTETVSSPQDLCWPRITIRYAAEDMSLSQAQRGDVGAVWGAIS